MKVPGRNINVTIVIAFMEELSLDILYEISTFVALSCWVTMLNTYTR